MEFFYTFCVFALIKHEFAVSFQVLVGYTFCLLCESLKIKLCSKQKNLISIAEKGHVIQTVDDKQL